MCPKQTNQQKKSIEDTHHEQSRRVSLRTHFYWDELDFIVYCMNFNELCSTLRFCLSLLSCHRIGDGFVFRFSRFFSSYFLFCVLLSFIWMPFQNFTWADSILDSVFFLLTVQNVFSSPKWMIWSVFLWFFVNCNFTKLCSKSCIFLLVLNT